MTGTGPSYGIGGTTYGLSTGDYVARIASWIQGVDPQSGVPGGRYSTTFVLAQENPHTVVPGTTVGGSVTVNCSAG